ncbi:MAG: hypothetical protein QG650_1101 [Patescibacteria group bacterium]|nr:hypothetical protein [Patescibacteria group bacterium]
MVPFERTTAIWTQLQIVSDQNGVTPDNQNLGVLPQEYISHSPVTLPPEYNPILVLSLVIARSHHSMVKSPVPKSKSELAGVEQYALEPLKYADETPNLLVAVLMTALPNLEKECRPVASVNVVEPFAPSKCMRTTVVPQAVEVQEMPLAYEYRFPETSLNFMRFAFKLYEVPE